MKQNPHGQVAQRTVDEHEIFRWLSRHVAAVMDQNRYDSIQPRRLARFPLSRFAMRMTKDFVRIFQ
jgi:hypothetical protein